MPTPASGVPGRKSLPHGLPFAPIKVGVLIDIDMGTKEDFLAALRFGFDEAHAEGVVTRPVELVVKEAIGLPRLEAKNTIDGYLALAAEAYTPQVPDALEGVLRKVRDQRPDCLAYLGYGYPTILMGSMFRSLGWDPPRIMTSAFQFCYAKPEWMAALEGWYGIDQMCEDNPRLRPMLDRFAAHLGKRRDHTVTALSYDTTRLIAEGLARAPLLTPAGVKDGLERVRMLPAVNGGPRTHMSLGPYDHKADKGDWLVIRRIEGGRTLFVGVADPG